VLELNKQTNNKNNGMNYWTVIENQGKRARMGKGKYGRISKVEMAKCVKNHDYL